MDRIEEDLQVVLGEVYSFLYGGVVDKPKVFVPPDKIIEAYREFVPVWKKMVDLSIEAIAVMNKYKVKEEGTLEREQERFDLCLPDKEVFIINEEKCICHCDNKHIQSVKE